MSARRASPPAMRTRWSIASSAMVTVPASPRSSSRARRSTVRMSSSVSERSCSTSERDSSGDTTENDGFSVVAPTSSTIRFSTAASSASCWVLEKRCTSSMNNTVCSPFRRRLRARSMTARTSLTPADNAESASNRRPVACEINDAERRLAGAGRPVQQHRRRPRSPPPVGAAGTRARAGAAGRRPRRGSRDASGPPTGRARPRRRTANPAGQRRRTVRRTGFRSRFDVTACAVEIE